MALSSLWKKLIPALAALLAAAGGFYYFYWMHTPQYAAGEIYQAVTKKDYQLFRERVDLEKVYSAALDDLTDEALQSDTRDHRLAAGLMRTLKKPLIDALIHETETQFHAAHSGNPTLMTPLVDTAKAYVGSAALSLTDIFDVEEKDGIATASVKLHDDELNHDFTWKVRLEKDVNGDWTATRVENLKEYLQQRKDVLQSQF